ncbi:MAG TPA: hypothetical protein VHN77_09470 [Phycisphaerales bacterium]|nr:hypothetical protein [Phycisphaerales bacterium]
MTERRGITLIEVMIVVAVVLTVLVVLGWVVGTRARVASRKIHDGTQVRGIHQGLVLWCQSCNDSYPLPSQYDKTNSTIAVDDPTTKNTTANIYSILVFNGFFSTELLVSPAETNPRIQVFAGYTDRSPPTAVTPPQALWDPAFSTDFIAGIGGTSYAHMVPATREPPQSPEGSRNSRWSNTFQSTEPVVGLRGPMTAGDRTDGKGVRLTTMDAASNTLRFFGPSSTWRGNVGYNDNHVQFEDSHAPQSTRCGPHRNAQASWDDFLFFDEYLPTDGPDHPYFINAYLGIFTKAGPTMGDYGAIWD